MGKVKKGTIFKIFIVTLLVILSTIGIVLSNYKEEQIELDDANKDTYYTYKAEVDLEKKPDWKAEDLLDKYKFLNHYVNETGKPLSGLLESVCTQLWDRCEIICSQKVKPISDAAGYSANTKYIEGSPAQSYILAQLENSAKGDDYYHREDPVQKAWWDLCTRLGVQESFREHSTGGADASEGEFSLRLSNPINEETDLDESYLSISSETSVIKSEEELKKIVRTYAAKNNFDKANDWYDAENNVHKAIDWYDAIIHLIDAFGESNKTYGSFKNANGEIDFKNLISSINVYKRYIDALKEENITGNDYENQYKEFFSADISDAKKTAVINSNKVGQYLGDKYVICTDWTKDAEGEQYVLDGQKVEEIFKYTDSTYFKHGVDLNYTRRPNAYAQLMNKFDQEQLNQLYLYIIQEYSGVFEGSDYEYDPANELLERAEKYEEFYYALLEDDKSKITLDTREMQVNKSDKLNAFVVGPFTANYTFGGITYDGKYELFGGITEFIVQTDKFTFISNNNEFDNQIKVGSTNKVDEETKELTTNLENGEFALVTSVEKNEKVDVVIRPEDIFLMDEDKGMVRGKLISKIFKGVHYEYTMMVGKNEVIIHDTSEYDINQYMSIYIKPFDIHIMKKEFVSNTYEGYIDKNNNVVFAEGEFECDVTQLIPKSHLDEEGYLITADGEKIDLTDVDVNVEVGLKDIEIRECNCSYINLGDCKLSSVSFYDSSFKEASFLGCDIKNL